MNYPLISEYIESIKSAEDNFNELTNLRSVLDDNGLPVMTGGNFAVVFKMKDEATGKLYALKCFTKEQQGREEAYHQIAEELKNVDSPYLVSLRYLEKELFVDTEQTDETEFPVLLMDWVEGKTLDKYLRENLDDKYALEMLAYDFSQLAQWLIPKPFAHGDLKPDNILVREDGSLVLVDYDGMYVPAMKGQKARELGSPDFQHPLRTEDDFDEHIDDFPLTSIFLSLKAISCDPDLLTEYGAPNRLLLSEKDYRDISNCKLLKDLFPSTDKELNICLSLLFIVDKERFLYSNTKFCFDISIPIAYNEASEADLANAWTDEFGFKYHIKRKALLQSSNVKSYTIKEGTKVIDNWAFHLNSEKINFIKLPPTIKIIGFRAFSCCFNLEELNMPDSINKIGACAFMDCTSLKKIELPRHLIEIQGSCFSGCRSLENVIIHNSVKIIRERAFSGCSSLKEIIIPESVVSIGLAAFRGCTSLKTVIFSGCVKDISSFVFSGCSQEIGFYVPKGTRNYYKKLLSKNGNNIFEQI